MRTRRILTLGLLGAAGYLGIRAARRYVSPENPEMARTYGEYMVARHRRVLVFVPLADDVERIGGTLRLMQKTGADIHLVATAGDSATSYDSGLPPATHLGYSLSDLQSNPRLLEDMRDLWRRVRPTLVLAPDPTHPLPLAARAGAMAVGRAVLTISRSMADGAETAFYATRLPNAVVDVRDTAIHTGRVDMEGSRRGMIAGLGAAVWARLSSRATGFRPGEAFRFLDLPEIRPVERPGVITESPHP